MGKHDISCKWVYKIKAKTNGSIEHYKAQFVAKGYSQEYGFDYEETLVIVAKMTSICSSISITTSCGWLLFQLDMKNVFLNGYFFKKVYILPPPGLSHLTCHLWRLWCALYGLKQAPLAWYVKFRSALLHLRFIIYNYDLTLFTSSSYGQIILLLYVDDMIITGDDSIGITSFNNQLYILFDMKDLGHLHYFLGIEVVSSPRGYILSQSKYTFDLFKCVSLTNTRTVDTPLNLHLLMIFLLKIQLNIMRLLGLLFT